MEWLLIRDTILFFFQDIHIRVSGCTFERFRRDKCVFKVSIFLRENLQTQHGQFIMNTDGIVPTGFQPPGEIR